MSEQLYDTDYYAWIQRQTELARQRRLGELDLDNLLEELEDMGKSRQRTLESRLEILFMHLLKWQLQPENRSNSWKASIIEQRRKLGKLLKENPSLGYKLPDILHDVYEDARIAASRETDLPLDTFPEGMPFTYERAVSHDFWPQ
uniref:DUF29 domain-containing protein n=1 Tax=Candidatus Kentrum eta TaxID=2126337 RepID=A0A450UFG5_9GAMM|nr:MAG: protein of unknown function DUF29 [Candidatus Kentron sp. H]VFJ91296.1 MAG: protein of unknown function DUF29 [Candidatus Kentron sp. H]VFJ97819.1 MAG: protein of unknown function DUF29 [Candidatus Kentron sp. H]